MFSTTARDVLRAALERQEDARLAVVAEERERTFDISDALSHEAVWRGRRAVPDKRP